MPIPLPDDPAAIVYNERVTCSKSRSVVLEVDGTRVEIMPSGLDWALLRLAIAEGTRARHVEDSGAPAH